MTASKDITLYIPARGGGARLPNKPLLHWRGKPLIWHAAQGAKQLSGARLYVVTDDRQIAKAAEAPVICCDKPAWCGTRRCWDAWLRMTPLAERRRTRVIINLQGDTLGVAAADLARLADAAAEHGCATLVMPLEGDEQEREDVVKAVTDWTGAVIGWQRTMAWCAGPKAGQHWHHVGAYAWSTACWNLAGPAKPTPESKRLSLEQLAWEMPIHAVVIQQGRPVSINTLEDYRRLLHCCTETNR